VWVAQQMLACWASCLMAQNRKRTWLWMQGELQQQFAVGTVWHDT
jgi:hypothetical protein